LDSEDIVAWVVKKTGPASLLVESASDFATKSEGTTVVVLTYLAALEGAEFDAYIALASANDDVTFMHTTTAEVAALHDVKVSSAIMLKEFDGGNVRFEGAIDKEEFEGFVKANKLPLVIPFNEKNADMIFSSGITKQLLLFFSSDDAAEVLATARQVREHEALLRWTIVVHILRVIYCAVHMLCSSYTAQFIYCAVHILRSSYTAQFIHCALCTAQFIHCAIHILRDARYCALYTAQFTILRVIYCAVKILRRLLRYILRSSYTAEFIYCAVHILCSSYNAHFTYCAVHTLHSSHTAQFIYCAVHILLHWNTVLL
jgi:hypothetical protein